MFLRRYALCGRNPLFNRKPNGKSRPLPRTASHLNFSLERLGDKVVHQMQAQATAADIACGCEERLKNSILVLWGNATAIVLIGQHDFVGLRFNGDADDAWLVVGVGVNE